MPIDDEKERKEQEVKKVIYRVVIKAPHFKKELIQKTRNTALNFNEESVSIENRSNTLPIINNHKKVQRIRIKVPSLNLNLNNEERQTKKEDL